MNKSDIEEIAGKLAKDLGSVEDTEVKEEIIRRLKNSPEDLNGFLFGVVEQHFMKKVFEQKNALGRVVSIPDISRFVAEVAKRWLEKIEEQGAVA